MAEKIKISDKELETTEAKITFVKLFGSQKYIQAMRQFAEQRLPPEKIAGMSDDALENLTQKQYEEKMNEIHRDLGKVADPKKPVHAEINAPDLRSLGLRGQDQFLSMFGYKRFMKAHGLEGLEELDNAAYHQVLGREYKPYRTSVQMDKVKTA